MKDVFISYKSEEFSEAKWVKTTLEENGISCWMAPDDIPGGSSYAAEILQAIRGAKVFVLVLSEAAQTSTHVAKELDIAINEHMTVMPFMLENCELKDDFYYYLSNVQRYAAYENKKKAVSRMMTEIKTALTPPEQPAQARSAPPIAETKPDAKPAKPAKPKKEKKPKTQKAHSRVQSADSSEKKPSKALKTVGIILAVIGLLIVFSVAVTTANRVEIAGEKFKKNATYITLEEATLSVEDVENIRKMEDLNALKLTDCPLSADVKKALLADLPYGTVTLSACGLTDGDMQGVTLSDNLANLDISGNDISSLDFMKNAVSAVVHLNISHTKITDISALSGAVSLEHLEAEGNGIDDISALENSTKLKKLYLSDNEIVSLNGLEYALELQELYVQNNKIGNLDGIANSTLLTDINISGNFLHDSDLAVLAKSAGTLKTLYATDNYFITVAALAPCTEMQELHLDRNLLTTLNGVEEMVNLKQLSASHNKITGVFELENCRLLTTVQLSDNFISDIAALHYAADGDRITLDVSHNEITSFDALPADADYALLNLYGNPVGDYTALGAINFVSLYIDYNESVDYTQFNKESDKPYTVYLLDVPLDKQKQLEEQIGTYQVTFTSEEELANNN